MDTQRTSKAFVALFSTFFMWGSVYVSAKLISGQLLPPLVACMRCTIAVAPLTLLARPHLKTKIEKQDYKYLFIVGALGYFLTINLVQLGISLTGASIASLINALTPISVTILAALILKESITPIKCLCLLLALLGTVIISSNAESDTEIWGIVVMLISVVSWGIASVFMRRLTAKYPPILVTTYGMTISLLFHIPVGIITAVIQPPQFDLTSIGVVLYLGFVGSGLAQFTWTKSLSILPASTCSLFYPLQPIFSAILGAIILRETFAPTFFAGLMLITLNVALITWEVRRTSTLKPK